MKTFHKTILSTLAVTALAAGTMLAQGAHHGQRGQWGEKMAAQLNLTADQQAQAKSIFQSARESAQPVRQQLKQERQALKSAIQSGQSQDQIQAIAQSEGPQLAQLAAVRAAAMAKFYAILTPDQQQKFTAMQQAHGARHQRTQPAPAQQ